MSRRTPKPSFVALFLWTASWQSAFNDSTGERNTITKRWFGERDGSAYGLPLGR
jgi:hypothetical protein